MIELCNRCQENLPSHQKESLLADPMPKRPFEHVAADLFTLAGKHYLVYADRLSSYPCVVGFNNDPTAQQVAYECRQFFANLGVPTTFRSDNGPQFAAASFKAFLDRWGVTFTPTTPHYPQANYAEIYVKLVKRLLRKLDTNDVKSDEFCEALMEL